MINAKHLVFASAMLVVTSTALHADNDLIQQNAMLAATVASMQDCDGKTKLVGKPAIAKSIYEITDNKKDYMRICIKEINDEEICSAAWKYMESDRMAGNIIWAVFCFFLIAFFITLGILLP